MPKVAWLQSVHLNHGLADAMRDTRDQGIAHAEGSMAIGHAGVGPALRESLELIELVGDKTAETTVGALDDMLKTAGSRAAFARENRSTRFIGGIREAHGSLGIRVRKARLFVGALFAFAALEVAPVRKLFVRDIELLWNKRLVDKYIAKHAALAMIVLGEVARQNMAALHDAGVLELRCFLTNAKASRVLVRIGQDIELGHFVGIDGGEGLCHNAVMHAIGKIDLAGVLLAEDINALAALGEPVFRRVDYTPFNGVIEIGEAAQDDGEVATALRCGRLEQTVNVLKETEAGLLHLEEVIYVPPKDTFLALDAVRLIEWTCNRVVLAREAADDHLHVGDFNLAGLSLLKYLVDIFVDNGIFTKAVHVATCRKLTRFGSGRFPLVCPNGMEGASGLHVKLGMTRVGIAFETQPKSTDARKKLGNVNLRHVSPIAAVSVYGAHNNNRSSGQDQDLNFMEEIAALNYHGANCDFRRYPMSKKHLDFKRMLDDTDFSDPSSIERYAANLDGMTFRDILELGIAPEGESAPKDFGSKKYKGGMGTLIEERYFGYKANSDDRPDFPEAGVELKATCFDVLKNGRKSAGERLVLTMIPYDRPVSLDYDNSHLKTKLSNILLIYYGRDRSIDKYDQRIERAVMVRLPEEDMKIIRADYEKIISYIQDGRADELSEGMTTYLGACTKGATEATMWVDQYYEYVNTDTGEIERRRAKRRAFSLKRSYMDYVLHTYVLGAPRVGESIVQAGDESIDFESFVTALVERHYGETDRQIAEQYGLEYTGNKAQWTTLVYRMLGIKSNAAEEFVKAGINVRACRVNKRGHIEQAMSFPPFEFKQLINEDWETSSFRARLETNRFFFVVFREDHEGDWRLDRCLFWAMPANEIEGPAKACWDETRKVISKGVELNPYRDANGKLKVTNNLPGMADNPIVHVRPHTSKAAYRFADGTEIGDIAKNAYELPDGRWMTRQSFWFNKSYLEHILGL